MPKNIERALGAKISAPDNRRIMVARVQAKVKRPTEFYFDDSQIPTEDQLEIGSCVGQAEGGEVECRELVDTKKVTPVSKRWLYAQCKKLDGFSGEGTYPTLAAEIKCKKGAAKKDFCKDDNTLSHREFIKLPEDSSEVKDDAAIRIAEAYAFVQPVLEDMLQAIFQNGTYTATLQVGVWDNLPVKPTPDRGAHRVRINGYREIEGDAMIWFRNSWGPAWGTPKGNIKLNEEEKKKVARGDGYFLFSQYEKYIWDQIVYTDVPYTMIMEARNKKYLFTRDLKYQSTGTDVMELQKALSKIIAKDGAPCFRYPTSAAPQFTTYFGRETELGVKRFQELKKIAKSGDSGYGLFGPKTRAAMNEKATEDSPAFLAAANRKIILNAGHDDHDPGAVTAKEADETKIIRDHTVIALKSAGFEVVEVSDDKNLSESIKFANKIAPNLNDALLIDIHLNSSTNKKERGVEAFYGTNDTSKKIAAVLSAHVAKSLGFTDRGAKPDSQTAVGSLGWLRLTKAWSTLIEVGFISNPDDMAVLRTPAGYKKAAQGIANAVMELYGVKAK